LEPAKRTSLINEAHKNEGRGWQEETNGKAKGDRPGNHASCDRLRKKGYGGFNIEVLPSSVHAREP